MIAIVGAIKKVIGLWMLLIWRALDSNSAYSQLMYMIFCIRCFGCNSFLHLEFCAFIADWVVSDTIRRLCSSQCNETRPDMSQHPQLLRFLPHTSLSWCTSISTHVPFCLCWIFVKRVQKSRRYQNHVFDQDIECLRIIILRFNI